MSGKFGDEARARAENGFYTIDDTAAHTGDWWAFEVVTDAVIASITDGDAGTGDITASSIAQGVIIYGSVTAITLTSGIVRMFIK